MSEKKDSMTDKMRHLGARIGILERHRRRYLNERLSSTGLVGHQFFMLLNLHHQPGMCQDEISDRLSIDKTRIARSATFLEENGYIRRDRDENNRRRYHLYLTQKGEDMIPVIRSVVVDWGKSVTKGIPEEKIDDFIDMLQQMLDNSK